MLQFIRRFIQLFVITLLVVIPILSLYEILIENFRLPMVQGRIWQDIFNFVDSIFRRWTDDPVNIVKNIKGNIFWTITIYDFTLSDPLILIGHIFGSRAFYISLLISALPFIIISVLFGRVFCGWICPMDFLLEINNKVRKLLYKLGLRPYNIIFSRFHKYALLFMGGILTLLLGVQLYAFIYPPAIINRETIHYIYYGSVGMGVVAVAAIMLAEVSLSERLWCRYFCPGGGLYSLLGIGKVVTIVRDKNLCDDCADCNRACEFGLNPMRDKFGMECNNCGKCISLCEKKGLSFKFGLPWRRTK